MTILAFIFVLGVLVFVHETGHFVVARWYGVRVITFSLGFGPKLLKFTSGNTEYAISAIPLGGYVKLAGETIEEQLSGAPDEFMSKSKWIRCQVYLAGPIMNLALAIVVLTFVHMGGADVAISNTAPPVIGSVEADSPAAGAGLRLGDRILSVNGREVPTWDALQFEILPAANRAIDLMVDRGGQRLQFVVTPGAMTKYELGDLGVGPVQRPQVIDVSPGSPAEAAGLTRGDVIVEVNGEQGMPQPRIIETIRASADQPVRFTLERGTELVRIAVTPEDSGGVPMIGARINEFEFRRIDPDFFEAFELSIQENWTNTVQIGRTLRGLFTRETPVRQLMGPVAIAELSGTAAQLGWQTLFGFMALISLNLGLLNLMPVPVLDGGHIMILAVEGLARRDLSVKVKERILLAGAAMIILLMVTVIFNDVARLLR
jgi:regulator of sigma E protease